MKNKLRSLMQLLGKYQFACFITVSIILAVIMTGTSLVLYRHSGTMKLDMSRPGYERVRAEVEKNTDSRPYSSSGELDDEAIKDFEKRLDDYRKELDELGDYDNVTMSDQNLNLVEVNNTETNEFSGDDSSN